MLVADDSKDPPAIFSSEEADQGDLPRAEDLSESDPIGGDGVPLRA